MGKTVLVHLSMVLLLLVYIANGEGSRPLKEEFMDLDKNVQTQTHRRELLREGIGNDPQPTDTPQPTPRPTRKPKP